MKEVCKDSYYSCLESWNREFCINFFHIDTLPINVLVMSICQPLNITLIFSQTHELLWNWTFQSMSVLSLTVTYYFLYKNSLFHLSHNSAIPIFMVSCFYWWIFVVYMYTLEKSSFNIQIISSGLKVLLNMQTSTN